MVKGRDCILTLVPYCFRNALLCMPLSILYSHDLCKLSQYLSQTIFFCVVHYSRKAFMLDFRRIHLNNHWLLYKLTKKIKLINSTESTCCCFEPFRDFGTDGVPVLLHEARAGGRLAPVAPAYRPREPPGDPGVHEVVGTTLKTR